MGEEIKKKTQEPKMGLIRILEGKKDKGNPTAQGNESLCEGAKERKGENKRTSKRQ